MLKIFKKFFGTKHEREVKGYSSLVNEINGYYEDFRNLSNDELRQKTNDFRDQISHFLSEIDADIAQITEAAEATSDFDEKESLFNQVDELKKERDEQLEVVLKDIMSEAFAVVKETARRFKDNDQLVVTATDHDRELAARKSYITIDGDKAIWSNRWVAAGGEIQWNMVHYDVQLIGGATLHSGKVAEMATGEGKTLVATLPAYLNGLSGLGVHVITVNNYLAIRDAEWVGPIFEYLLLTVDCIDKYKPHSEGRSKAYKCDITYGTNNEFGFDYLRDNMVRSMDEMVQQKHHFVMIDEVDSVLIDDARTPLIISGPVPKDAEHQEYEVLNPKVRRLVEAQKKLAMGFLTDAKKKIAEGLIGKDEGEGGMSLLRAYRAMPKYRPLIKYLSEDGIKQILQKTENSYMQEQSKHMHLVDKELLYTIDEKNKNVELSDKGVEFLSKGENDPGFFVMPDFGSEMAKIDNDTALAETEKRDQKQELVEDYAIKSRRLHGVSQLLKAYSLFEKDEEYVVIDEQVKIVDEQTGRMMEGRRYSDGLHQALEAKENVKIGELTQTYATITLQNYFRMYHKISGMTGTAETEASELWEIYKLDVVVIPTNKPIVRDDREDLVFRTDREKFNAVIDEIVALSKEGRPVLVGTTSVDISEKLSRMLNLKGIQHNVLNAKQHQREAEIVTEAGKPGNVTIATNMAGRGTDIKISDDVKSRGGLAIIGTARHDSRRVDRQLRGRAGRQGDPGSSQFYVSLEDQLMRLFLSDRAVKTLDRLGHKEGEVLQHSMMTKSIERAQKKVEENNFGIRKRLLEYDDVMNIQREAIYTKRKNALSGERLSLDLHTMIEGYTESLVEDHKSQGNYDTFREACLTELGYEPKISQGEFESGKARDILATFKENLGVFYQEKNEHIKSLMMPVISSVYENEGHKYKRIALPLSGGGTRVLNVAADLASAVESNGDTIKSDIEKTVTLALIDENWKEHLRSMDELKESVQSASFEQKDPLVVYKMEAYNLFEHLIYKINKEVTSWLYKGKIMIEEPQDIHEAKVQKTDLSKTHTNKEEEAAKKAAASAGRAQREKVETFVRQEAKVGRNEPCPCGSGKKYKHCHGR